MTDESYEILRDQHRRLRPVAQAVVDASNYPTGEGEARVYRSQLRALERELRGEPQPHGMAWMSVS
jgi:hypothetical protein